jgi:hypothetical protein
MQQGFIREISMHKEKFIFWGINSVLTILTIFLSNFVLAQKSNYPNQPIKFVVPYSPGGLPDTVARQLSVQLGSVWGKVLLWIINLVPVASSLPNMSNLRLMMDILSMSQIRCRH